MTENIGQSGSLLIYNGEVVTPAECFFGGILVEKHRIATVFCGKPNASQLGCAARSLDAAGCWILPGFIDLHLHGACGIDFNSASVKEVMRAVRFHASAGVTSLLPAVMTDSWSCMAEAVGVIRRARQRAAAPEILGVHLEGPCLNPAYKGAHPEEHLRLPDPDLLKEIWDSAGDDLAMITLAPELKGGLEAVSYFSRRGVVAALGHSSAEYEQIKEAVSAGMTHAVHTYSAMAGFHHRRPGTLGAVLTLDELSAELIADGIHAHPAAVKLLCRVKGPHRIVLVTDASPGVGLAGEEISMGPQTVTVCEGACRLADGTLAGSTLTMNRALAGAVEMAGIPFETAVAAAGANPARVLGLEGRKGSLDEGKDADVIVMDRSYQVLLTVCRGEIVHNRLDRP